MSKMLLLLLRLLSALSALGAISDLRNISVSPPRFIICAHAHREKENESCSRLKCGGACQNKFAQDLQRAAGRTYAANKDSNFPAKKFAFDGRERSESCCCANSLRMFPIDSCLFLCALANTDVCLLSRRCFLPFDITLSLTLPAQTHSPLI